jgi:tetratricopeptide (TPR) repeat protein
MQSSVGVLSRPASAIADLESYVSSHPGNAAAHFRLGQVYHEARDRQAALEHFAEAVNLSPQDLNFRKMLADFQYVELGDLESAITNYVRILDQDPRNIENLTILGNISLSMGRFAEARTFFSTVARLEPWNGEVQKILEAIARKQGGASPTPTYKSARELAQCGRTADAISALESIVSADPRHFLAHNDLGVLYGSQGNADLALKHALAAVQGEPDNIIAHKNLGDLYHSVLQQPEEAMRQYLEVLRRSPADIETLLSIGSLCVGLGRTEEARSFFSMVLAHQPGHALAREMLGRLEPVPGPELDPDGLAEMFGDPQIDRILREKEKYAREYFTDVLLQEPGNLSARRGLDGLESEPPADTRMAETRYADASRSAARGDVACARRLLEEVLRIDPSFAAAHNDLAVLSGADGDNGAAQEHYEAAIAIAPDNITFLKNLGDFHFAVTGNAEAALAQYVRVLERRPQDIETLLCIGQVCEQLGRPEDASVFYGTAAKLDPANDLAREALRRTGIVAGNRQGRHAFAD